jgi:iron complex transport system substrate-binding protein
MTETLFALHVGNKLVGISSYCDYPSVVEDFPKVGGLKVDVETLLQLKPDLILGLSSLNKNIVSDLRRLGFSVFLQRAQTIQEVLDNIQELGALFERQSIADSIVISFKAREKKIHSMVKAIPLEERPKVFLEHYPGLYTAGVGTFLHELIIRAGGTNIASDIQGWGRLNEEAILVQNPDVILYTRSEDPKQQNVLKEVIESRKHWHHLKAFQTKKVRGIHQDKVSRAGPRLIQGLEEIHHILYLESYEAEKL